MMSNQPLVSIVVPSYNVAKYIGAAIDSVLAQTYSNWELLITDDASTDGTVDVVTGYIERDARIHLYRLEKNCGAGVARNNSLEHAQGRYIAFLDADDWWYPNKLELQMQFMLSNGYEFTFTAFEYADAELNVIGVSHKPKSISKLAMKFGCNIGTPGVVYDTQRIGKMYMPPMRNSEDWSLWIEIAEKTGAAYSINRPLWRYRTLQGSQSRDKLRVVNSVLKVYTDILHWSKLRAILTFALVFMPQYVLKVVYNRIDSHFYLRSL